MRRLTDGERDVLRECEADARGMGDDIDDGCDEPTATLTGCPGAGPYPAVPALPDDDEETEADYGPGDWWDIGYTDGLYGAKRKPPCDNTPDGPGPSAAAYAEGYATGALERDAEARRRAEPPLPPHDTDDIPF